MEPHYVLVIDIRVERGEISNGTILLPLPTKDDTIFYGIQDYCGTYDNLTVNITNSIYGEMFNAANYYQDKNINAKNPIDNEHLLTPKY